MAWAASSPVELVVITGGEPLIQQRTPGALVRGLLAAGKRVEFETNGTIAPDPALVVDGVRFNVSPKLASFGVKESKSIVPAALEAFAASGQGGVQVRRFHGGRPRPDRRAGRHPPARTRCG